MGFSQSAASCPTCGREGMVKHSVVCDGCGKREDGPNEEPFSLHRWAPEGWVAIGPPIGRAFAACSMACAGLIARSGWKSITEEQRYGGDGA